MSPPARSVLHLAWPLVLSFWMRQLFTFVDTWFAADIGDHAVAGIGLAFPYEFLFVACWVGTSTGMTSLLSRAMGAHEGERCAQIIRTSRRVAFAFVPLFSALGAAIWLRPAWFVSSGVSADALEQFRIYGSVIVGGTALTGFWSIIPDSIVKAHHDTKATMWAGIASNLVNVVLTILFVRGFGWGMFGIAFSTVLGRLAALLYALTRAHAHESARLRAGLDTARGLAARPYRSLAVIAVPAGLAYVLMATESAIVNALLASGANPTATLATYSIYYRFLMFFLMPVIACGVALLPFTARAWGQRDVGAIRRATRDVGLAALAYVVVLVVPTVLLFRVPIAARFASEPLTRALTEWGLLMAPIACLAAIPFFICRPVFEGLQRANPGLIMAALRYLILTAPTCWLGMYLARSAGLPVLQGVVVALIVVTALSSATFAAWMRSALSRAEREPPPKPIAVG